MSSDIRKFAYGQEGLSRVDRLGVWLSKQSVRGLMRQVQRPSVLDLGCGYEAALLRDLDGQISRGVGVDVRVSEAAKQSAGLKFLEEPIEQALVKLAGERFDLILLINVLEHMWDAQQVLTACRSMLAPSGRLAVNVPNWLGKLALEFSAFRLGFSPVKEVDDHKMYYAKRDLWPMLVRAGFRPRKIRMRYHKLGLNLFATAQAGVGDE